MEIASELRPENEQQAELLRMLTTVREYGLEETDMSRAELATTFAHFSSGLYSEDVETAEKDDLCPKCGEYVAAIEYSGIGGDAVISPCGCQLTAEDISEAEFGELPNADG